MKRLEDLETPGNGTNRCFCNQKYEYINYLIRQTQEP